MTYITKFNEFLKNAKVGDLVLFKFVDGYNSGFIHEISESEKAFWIAIRLYTDRFKYKNVIYPGYQNYKFNIEDIEEFEILKTYEEIENTKKKENIKHIEKSSSFNEKIKEVIKEFAEKIINIKENFSNSLPSRFKILIKNEADEKFAFKILEKYGATVTSYYDYVFPFWVGPLHIYFDRFDGYHNKVTNYIDGKCLDGYEDITDWFFEKENSNEKITEVTIQQSFYNDH